MNGLQQKIWTPFPFSPLGGKGGKFDFWNQSTDFDEILYAITLHGYDWITTRILDPSPLILLPWGGERGQNRFLERVDRF